MTAQPEFEDKLAVIRKRFVATLEEWLPIFEEFARQVNGGNPQVDKLADIRMQVHKLAGSSNMFGFEDLNHHAIKLEDCLDEWIEKDWLAVADGLPPVLDQFLAEVQAIVITAAAKQDEPEEVTVADTQKSSDEYRFHLLVADDDVLVQDLFRQGLADADCQIISVVNGKEVFKTLTKQKKQRLPDLIVLDVNMPELNGFEVLEKLKADKHLQDIPVIMLTRQDDDESIIKGITAGALDYITKPFEVAELGERVIQTLQNHKTRILVADDDELVCDLLRQHFARLGYSVFTAENGEEALVKMKQLLPDIAVLDIMMPSIDGLSVLKQAQENPELAHIPVVILTAKGQHENVLQGLESGAYDYITKPFDVDEVAARVLGILRRRKNA